MPRTTYGVYHRAHPRFVEAFAHLESLYEDKPDLKPGHAATLARIRKEMIEGERLTEADRRKVRDILRQLRRPMPRAFVGRISRGEEAYDKKHFLFQEAKSDLEEFFEEFGHASTPPALKPEHASHLRDIHDMMAFRGKLYESQRKKLYEILDQIRRREKD